MGSCASGRCGHNQTNVLVIGLDHSGKSTIVCRWKPVWSQNTELGQTGSSTTTRVSVTALTPIVLDQGEILSTFSESTVGATTIGTSKSASCEPDKTAFCNYKNRVNPRRLQASPVGNSAWNKLDSDVNLVANQSTQMLSNDRPAFKETSSNHSRCTNRSLTLPAHRVPRLTHAPKTPTNSPNKSATTSNIQEYPVTVPTIGFNVETLNLSGLQLTVIDMSGQGRYRSLWATHYGSAEGVVFVLDSSDTLRLPIVQQEVDEFVKQMTTIGRNVPLLLYANKADVEGALGAHEIVGRLGLTKILRSWRWNMCRSNALTGEGLYEGTAWLTAHLLYQRKTAWKW